MARPVRGKAKLTRPVSFRLTDEDFDAYQRKFAASGLTQSEFFREAVLGNRTHVIERKKSSADYRRLLFLFNKASNNLNQLAHRANTDHLARTLSEGTYSAILGELELISRYLKATVNHADQD